MRHLFTFVVALLIVAGCKKRENRAPEASASPKPATASALKLHWIGKDRLAADTNALNQMAIWNLPESARLESQTLDKLAAAVRDRLTPSNTNSEINALLRPLFDDLVRAEIWLEVRTPTNAPSEFALALHLAEDRGRLWETNLAAVARLRTEQPATNVSGIGKGFEYTQSQPPVKTRLLRVVGWSVLGAGPETNALFSDVVDRIQRFGFPFAAANTNWLEIEADLQQLVARLRSNPPTGLPSVRLTARGVGGDVRTSGELTFPQPLQLEFEPWNLPTNLIHEPLMSFTAIRGFKPWLASQKQWQNLQIGPPPDQICFWALGSGPPMLSYFAAPASDAGDQVNRLADYAFGPAERWIAPNQLAGFMRSPDANGIIWAGLPFMVPFLRSVTNGQNAWFYGGFFPDRYNETNQPPAAALLDQFLGRTNLLVYDWEITGPRVEAWKYMTQFFRLVFGKAQLSPGFASVAWFEAVGPKLGNSATAVNQTGDAQLSFIRNATIGFTAIEVHLLADWLESPQFPRGLHTFDAPPDPSADVPLTP